MHSPWPDCTTSRSVLMPKPLVKWTVLLPHQSFTSRIHHYLDMRYQHCRLLRINTQIWLHSACKFSCETLVAFLVFYTNINADVIVSVCRFDTILILCLTPFRFHNCLNSTWHWFNKVLKALFTNVGPYWQDSILQLMEINGVHIQGTKLPFHHIPKMLYWVEIWWLWGPF